MHNVMVKDPVAEMDLQLLKALGGLAYIFHENLSTLSNSMGTVEIRPFQE